MHVHTIGNEARKYVLAHGGKIIENESGESFEVTVPEPLLSFGGYGYHGGQCWLYAYADGAILDNTIETGDHSLTYKRLSAKNISYFPEEDQEKLQALLK